MLFHNKKKKKRKKKEKSYEPLIILVAQEAEIRRITVLETLSQKNPSPKRAGRVAQMVQHLPSK
jgi:hypothetical protein